MLCLLVSERTRPARGGLFNIDGPSVERIMVLVPLHRRPRHRMDKESETVEHLHSIRPGSCERQVTN